MFRWVRIAKVLNQASPTLWFNYRRCFDQSRPP